MSWNYSPRSALSFGGYGSKYEATHIDSNATGAGTSIEWNTNWTPLLSTDATVVYQRTKVDQTVPNIVHANVNAWGATFGAVYKAQISQYRLNVGRIITPSGAGGVYVNDQIQFQYNRDLSERFAFTGALIALSHNHADHLRHPGVRSRLRSSRCRTEMDVDADLVSAGRLSICLPEVQTQSGRRVEQSDLHNFRLSGSAPATVTPWTRQQVILPA